MDSPIVTLTTDWGYRDFFAGMVKGRLYSSIPGVRVVDITHGIDPYQLGSAIFVARQCCQEFPKGTIHIIDVKSTYTPMNPHIVVEHNGHFYLCTDNGLPHALFGDDTSHMVALSPSASHEGFGNFAAYDIFCDAAARLAHGASIGELGTPVQNLTRHIPLATTHNGNIYKTHIAYIDAYGNANLTMSYAEFERERQGRKFEMQVHEMNLYELLPNYAGKNEVGNRRAALLLTVSSTGMLQLAIREGSAEQLFGLQVLESITIRFF